MVVEEAGNSLAEGLLDAEAKGSTTDAAAASEDRKSLVISILTLIISIPALIGA